MTWAKKILPDEALSDDTLVKVILDNEALLEDQAVVEGFGDLISSGHLQTMLDTYEPCEDEDN